jgi:hypothetical protein
MQTKTKVILGVALVAAAAVVISQRKKLMALMSMQGMGDGPIPGPAPALAQTAVTTQSVAQIADTTVKSLTGIAGLALAAMSVTEKRRALAKS